ncbi:MAG: HAD-IA family hydrolase [Methylococcales bacterium]|nr:HAD-IA family hydrolase [Methylococcales bacterium]
MKNRFDLIIFDWDGTLINSIDWIAQCLQYAAIECHYPIPSAQAAKDVIGLSIFNAMQALFPGVDLPTQERLVGLYSQKYASKELNRDDLFPGVYEMLVQFKESGYQLAVATGKTRLGLQHALAATGTEDLFSITRCSDETASKPDPKMLHEIIRHTDTAKERALMVGDSIHDLQMAHNAPMSVVAVSCGAHSAECLQRYNPLLCLQQPTELLNFI